MAFSDWANSMNPLFRNQLLIATKQLEKTVEYYLEWCLFYQTNVWFIFGLKLTNS
jgi:hypothetical protein